MRIRTARRLLATLVAMQSGSLLASGFALNEQNASDLGQAFAGRSSMATDASTVFTNPAGMSFLERGEISGGFAGIMSSTDISNVRSPVPGTNDGDPVPTTAIPFAYWAQPLEDGWSVGLGFYVPFGLVTEYEDTFQGRYFGTKSELKQYTVQPTVAYRFNEQWSIGLGVSYNYIEGELSRDAPHPVILGGPDVRSRVEGDDSASWGYNVGVLFQPMEGTRIGLTYRSEVDYGLEGKTTLAVPGAPTQRFDAALDITLPAVADFSVTQRLDDRWTLYATAMWTDWSSFDELVVENRGFTNVVEPQEWEDTWLYSIGASVQVTPQWLLRAGIGADETPTRDEHRSVRVPNGDRLLFGLGASWMPSDEVSADLAYMYIKEEEINVGSGTAYQADFQTDIHIVSVQLNYRF